MKTIKSRMIAPNCYFDCEMIVDPDVSLEHEEITSISKEELGIINDGIYLSISINDFKNTTGQTIGEFILDNHYVFAQALLEKNELENREEF